jgi:AraC family transcriptional regulator, exoenzyme S synthesis regulatory protein ExsA
MINLYEALKQFPPFSRRLTCRELLFTNYDCPQTNPREQFLIECSHIAYVLSGRRIFHKDGKKWELKEGSCVFIRNGVHVSEKPADDGWCVMVFFVPDHFLRQLFHEHRQNLSLAGLPAVPTEHIIPLDVNELSRSFFISMLPYFSQSPPPPENLLELKFKELVLSLLSNKNNKALLAYLEQLGQQRYPSLEEIMLNNYKFGLSISHYARLACKSVPVFKRDFKKIFHESPARWVLRKRLDLAGELLQNSTMTVSEVASECGFENPTHFSRVFKEKTGISPTQYRLHSRQTA